MNALLEGKFTKVDFIFGCSDQVNELAHFRFEGSFQEEFQEVNITWVGAKMDFEQVVNGGFEHERVVDGIIADTRVSEPARLSTTRDRRVHHIICYEEVCLQEFDGPP